MCSVSLPFACTALMATTLPFACTFTALMATTLPFACIFTALTADRHYLSLGAFAEVPVGRGRAALALAARSRVVCLELHQRKLGLARGGGRRCAWAAVLLFFNLSRCISTAPRRFRLSCETRFLEAFP